jgi:hypothetical protein
VYYIYIDQATAVSASSIAHGPHGDPRRLGEIREETDDDLWADTVNQTRAFLSSMAPTR